MNFPLNYSGVKKALHILEDIVSTSTSVIYPVIDALLSRQKGFSAKFGTESQIASVWNKGFLISTKHRLTKLQSFENMLIAGPTGSGKTTRLLLKDLFLLKHCSIIVNDPSKELYLNSSGYLSQYFNIRTLNFCNSEESSGYNVLARIRQPSDVYKIAAMLVQSTIGKNASDPFWVLQSKSMLSLFIKLVLYQPKEYRHLANVRYLINLFSYSPKVVDRLIIAAGDEQLLAEYKSFVAMPEKTLMNVVASVKASLEIVENPEIAKVLSHDSIDFEKLRMEPTILFIHNSISEQKYISVLNSIFFEQLYGIFCKSYRERMNLTSLSF